MDNVIIFLIILIVLFLIGRELVCWYFKINQTVSLLEEIRDSLKNTNPQPENSSDPKVAASAADAEVNDVRPTSGENFNQNGYR